MKKEVFLEKLLDHNKWIEFCKLQKFVADQILDNCIIKNVKKLTSKEQVTLWSNAHYHYGIAIENGLKATIIRNFPQKVKYHIKDESVTLKGIGGNSGKNHNLLTLADEADIFNKNIKLFKYESDYKSLRLVLQHLSDMIKWGSRYPIPINNKKIFKFNNSIPPTLVYGFHILDVMEPLFKYFDSIGQDKIENQ